MLPADHCIGGRASTCFKSFRHVLLGLSRDLHPSTSSVGKCQVPVGLHRALGSARGPRAHGPRAQGPWAQGPGAQARGPSARGPRARGPRAHGPRAHGPWAHGPMGPGPIGPWAHGPLGPWAHVPMGPWALGPKIWKIENHKKDFRLRKKSTDLPEHADRSVSSSRYDSTDFHPWENSLLTSK